MKNVRRIKVDFPDVDLTEAQITRDYFIAGKDVVEKGEVPSVDVFMKRLDEYNHLQHRLMKKIDNLCESMECMVEDDFVIINSLTPVFEEVDDITEKMDNMTYFIPRDDVLDVLERYLSLHQKLFNKPIFYVEDGWKDMPKYEL